MAVAEGTQAMIDASTYKREALYLKKEVTAKDVVIAEADKERKTAKALIDSQQAQIRSLWFVNGKQEAIIRRQGEPKPFGLGFGVGYGYYLGPEIKRGTFIGAMLTWNPIRF